MLVRYDYIDQFFKQKSFTNVHLDALRQTVEEKGYGTSERKAAMSLIDMHLAAYAIGSTLKDAAKTNNQSRPFKNYQDRKSKRNTKRKQTSSKSTRTLTGLSKSKQGKYHKMSEAQKLTYRMTHALKNLNSIRGESTKKRKQKNKVTASKPIKETQKVEDAKTREIRDMLKKRGESELTALKKQSQAYRGSKNTHVKIIYTRM